MFISVAQGVAVVGTPFDEKYDLIQKFRGVEIGDSIRYNQPVDFMEAGLMQNILFPKETARPFTVFLLTERRIFTRMFLRKMLWNFP